MSSVPKAFGRRLSLASVIAQARAIGLGFSRWSLSRQFFIASFPIFILGSFIMGKWVALQVETGIVNRVGAVTGLYVDSLVGARVQSLRSEARLPEKAKGELDSLLSSTPLGKRIVAFRIWNTEGRLVYSTEKSTVGQKFPIGPGLRIALDGAYSSQVEHAGSEENKALFKQFSRLIETYVPLRADGTGTIIGAAEFYHATADLDRESFNAQIRSWGVVTLILAVIYSLLFGLVHRGSRTIERQRAEKKRQLEELTRLNREVGELNARVRKAAAGTAQVQETFLRRISADLHDGPAQDLSFAALQLSSPDLRCAHCLPLDGGTHHRNRISVVRESVECALAELRSIARGLQLPDLANLTVEQVAHRAVDDYRRKAGVAVSTSVADCPGSATLPLKIALYRLLQESLINGFRHAGGEGQTIRVSCQGRELVVDVSDAGPGFDETGVAQKGRLGLTSMRQRVEALAGDFVLQSVAGKGTHLHFRLPLSAEGIAT